MAATQMNVRLDANLKASGDAVLEREGVSSSQAVRALWEYLAVQDRIPDGLRMVLDNQEFDAKEFERELRLEAVERGANLVSEFYRQFDIPEPDPNREIDYDALLEAEMKERHPEYFAY